jgi:phosphatidylserine decarboxylase
MFAKEGYTTIAITVGFSALMAAVGMLIDHWTAYIFYGIGAVVLILILNFFRDPDRETPQDEYQIVAPADGKVIEIKEVEEPEYLNGNAKQISIFLSIFDVHVNRIPMSGELEYLQYHPGDYLVAWHEKSSELNERADFGIKHKSGTKLFFRQITGFLARRIVYHIQKGDRVEAGKRFGMMKFGSRMDILVPENVDITIGEGDYTTGGESILGRIQKQENEISDTEEETKVQA